MKKIFRPKIMIICNGSVAEPQYFQSFKDFLKIPASIKIISNSTGSDSPWRLIERAIKVKGNNNGTEIWCVFDIDQYLENNEVKLRAAFKLAAENGIFWHGAISVLNCGFCCILFISMLHAAVAMITTER